jgi:hypothetical protein
MCFFLFQKRIQGFRVTLIELNKLMIELGVYIEILSSYVKNTRLH